METVIIPQDFTFTQYNASVLPAQQFYEMYQHVTDLREDLEAQFIESGVKIESLVWDKPEIDIIDFSGNMFVRLKYGYIDIDEDHENVAAWKVSFSKEACVEDGFVFADDVPSRKIAEDVYKVLKEYFWYA